MNKNFLMNPDNTKLYDYYWGQIQESAKTFNGVESLKKSLQNLANNTFSVKMLSDQMTNELCKTSVYALLVEILRSSDDIGYALEFLKKGESNIAEVNRDESSYTNRLISKIKDTLSLSLSDITRNKQVIDINKLRVTLKSTIRNFYEQYPEYRGTSRPVKALQNEVTKVFDSAFEIRKTLEKDKTNQSSYNQ